MSINISTSGDMPVRKIKRWVRAVALVDGRDYRIIETDYYGYQAAWIGFVVTSKTTYTGYLVVPTGSPGFSLQYSDRKY